MNLNRPQNLFYDHYRKSATVDEIEFLHYTSWKKLYYYVFIYVKL